MTNTANKHNVKVGEIITFFWGNGFTKTVLVKKMTEKSVIWVVPNKPDGPEWRESWNRFNKDLDGYKTERKYSL